MGGGQSAGYKDLLAITIVFDLKNNDTKGLVEHMASVLRVLMGN